MLMGTLTDFVGVPICFYRALFLKKRQTSCNFLLFASGGIRVLYGSLQLNSLLSFPTGTPKNPYF